MQEMSDFAQTLPTNYAEFRRTYDEMHTSVISWGFVHLLRDRTVRELADEIVAATDVRVINIIGRSNVTPEMFIAELPPISMHWAVWGTYLDVATKASLMKRLDPVGGIFVGAGRPG